jgi:hypothetical protein
MNKEKLRDETFLGIVVDNNDPKKLGRCKIRVFQVFDGFDPADIPWALPWKDLNGSEFMLPEIGKYVSVVFDQGNKYSPEYIYAQNFNINLEKKLATLNGEDYTSMRAIMFDHSTQIYRNKTEGLKIDHEYSNINLDQWGNVCINLRDNKSVLTLGSKDAEEEAVLGTSFMKWMDRLIEALIGSSGPAYLDGSGAPVTISPTLGEVLMDYSRLRSNSFLSRHVRIPQNQEILAQKRDYINQRGDGDQAKILPASPQPESVIVDQETGKADLKEEDKLKDKNPATEKEDLGLINPEGEIKLGSGGSGGKAKWPAGYENGKIPSKDRVASEWLFGTKTGKWFKTKLAGSDAAKLHPQAAKAVDALIDAYEKAEFDGKCVLTGESGYRTYEQQVSLKKRIQDNTAAKAGNSPHGWGIAIDLGGWANQVRPMVYNLNLKHSPYRHPVYQWLFNNGWKFGIYSPLRMRDGAGTGDEWWHFEWEGLVGPPAPQIPRYSQPFTYEDYQNYLKGGITIYTLPESVRKQRDSELDKKRAQAKKK